MKNILYITSKKDIIGGGETSLVNLMMNLDSNEFTAHVVLPKNGSLSTLLQHNNISHFHLDLPKIKGIRPHLVVKSILALKKTISDLNIKLVHGNDIRAMVYGAIAGLLSKVPRVWHVQVAYKKEMFVDRVLYLFSTKVICISSAVLKRFDWAKKNGKLILIYYGVDLARFRPKNKKERKKLCAELSIKERSFIISTVSQIVPWKRIDVLIRSAKIITSEKPNTIFIICGKPQENRQEYFNMLKSMIRKLGLENNIHFIGFREDIDRILAASDLFVLPSENETFGRVLIEAMASGVPVAASRTGGIPDIIENRVNGFLFEVGDFQKLGAIAIELINNPGLCQKIGISGRKKVLQEFQNEKQTEKIQKLYNTLIK
jgi:glycosyltransferase involved in cell wall biosynthesis